MNTSNNERLIDPLSAQFFKEHPVDQILEIISILAVVRGSESESPREQGTVEWGRFILIGVVMAELRVLANRFGRDIDLIDPHSSKD